mmetsp:Transcript_36164/g.48931  ORF Transcript_36164/g.48931 Transcript_36164/m.48931 type:complete len:304 (-) Transcript_36164:1472-2383(-)
MMKVFLSQNSAPAGNRDGRAEIIPRDHADIHAGVEAKTDRIGNVIPERIFYPDQTDEGESVLDLVIHGGGGEVCPVSLVNALPVCEVRGEVSNGHNEGAVGLVGELLDVVVDAFQVLVCQGYDFVCVRGEHVGAARKDNLARAFAMEAEPAILRGGDPAHALPLRRKGKLAGVVSTDGAGLDGGCEGRGFANIFVGSPGVAEIRAEPEKAAFRFIPHLFVCPARIDRPVLIFMGHKVACVGGVDGDAVTHGLHESTISSRASQLLANRDRPFPGMVLPALVRTDTDIQVRNCHAILGKRPGLV